ncbi:MAG TPA: 3-dehydroquinate synthase family protein [Thermoanaerobaculia bacterium]
MMHRVESFDLAHAGGTTRLLYGESAIAEGARELAARLGGRALFVVSAPPIRELHEAAVAPLVAVAGSAVWLDVADGEAAKSVGEAERLWMALVAAGCRRDDCVVGFGGGSVTDVAGFVAGTILRGVDWVAVPTTLLAQVDAAIGGKTAIDLPAAKNAVGVFHHPLAVLAEPGVLATLDGAQRRHGLVESIKTAAMLDLALFERIERRLDRVLAGDAETRAAVVVATARAKARLVERDPREAGARQLLNFGHTLGHALEAEVGYGRLAHGDAVAHGMRFALALSRAAGCDEAFAARVEAVLDRLAVPPLPPLAPAALLAGLERDKKARTAGLGWVLLAAPGEGRYGVRLAPEAVAAALSSFFRRTGGGPL